ncbi:hypothetical protein ACVWZA_003935 [Sphingomonas sp. UYAg733]
MDRCKRCIQENADDPILVEAYQAKLDKELEATRNLLTLEAIEAVYRGGSGILDRAFKWSFCLKVASVAAEQEIR